MFDYLQVQIKTTYSVNTPATVCANTDVQMVLQLFSFLLPCSSLNNTILKLSGNKPFLIIAPVLNTGGSWIIIWRPPVSCCDLLLYNIIILTSSRLFFLVGKWRKGMRHNFYFMFFCWLSWKCRAKRRLLQDQGLSSKRVQTLAQSVNRFKGWALALLLWWQLKWNLLCHVHKHQVKLDQVTEPGFASRLVSMNFHVAVQKPGVIGRALYIFII